ncbi:Protoporphyrinogen oxidase [Xylaria cf. heliscus]|nr:Protoporphyrinogen oxidase [Xylaria cf. heliscus]
MTFQRTEDAFITLLRSAYRNAGHPALRLTARRSAFVARPGPPVRRLSTLPRLKTCCRPSNGYRIPCESSGVAVGVRKQPYATTAAADTNPRNIAVLGAGITGLTAAHYLARHAKNAHITIYEASNRPAGWIKADRVQVEGAEGQQGHVLLQNGPRMLRPGSSSHKYDDLVLYDVLANLDMTDKIRHPQSNSGTRYLYYPDHLVRIPSTELSIGNLIGTVQSFLTEPLWSGGLHAVLNYWRSYNKTLDPSPDSRASIFNQVPEEESVAQFLTRILNDDKIVNNVVSGVMHGIYGGDINKLSAKHTMLDDLWYHFKKPLPPGKNLTWVNKRDLYLLWDMLSGPNRLKIIELAETAVDWKLLAFEDGLLSLTKGLTEDLKKRSNVTFKYSEPVTSLEYKHDKVLVTTQKAKEPAKYDHVICTLFSKQLAKITEPRNSLPSLAETHAVTMMVVNLWYPNPNLLPEGGFGYLIPSSTPDNYEGALGVLFDSELRTGGSEMPGTKLTVMFGGHHWDGWEHFPSEEMGITMGKEIVRRHLGISETEKVVARAHLCRDCLPQHFMGHRKRMRDAHYELMSTFQGHLTVAGPSYTTIGVIPAMRAGFDAGMRVARGRAQPFFRIPMKNHASTINPMPEVDYWLFEKFGASGEVTDMVGASGLEQFTESEWTNLIPYPRRRMLFRKFTHKMFRFRSQDGQFIEADMRAFKNAPPGFIPVFTRADRKN